MKKKKLPPWITNQTLTKVLQSKIATYASYWIFQGMLYMDPREAAFKIFIDLFMISLLHYLLNLQLYLSFFIAHTLNMFLNGHYIALRRHMGLGKNDSTEFLDYLISIQKRIQTSPYIMAAAVYGSLSFDIYRTSSDIDVRFIPHNNNLSFLKTSFLATRERMRAFFMGFPLDLYVFTISDIEKKMNPKEPPIIFFDPDNVLVNKYNTTVQFDTFISNFKNVHIEKK